MNYNTDMSAADKDAESLLLVVPTGRADEPLQVELGRWDADDEVWTGEWRHTQDFITSEPTAMSHNDPIAWAPVPEIDRELYPTAAAAE